MASDTPEKPKAPRLRTSDSGGPLPARDVSKRKVAPEPEKPKRKPAPPPEKAPRLATPKKEPPLKPGDEDQRLPGLLRRRRTALAAVLALGLVITILLIRPGSVTPGPIASLFTREVRHWEMKIETWAAEYKLDPNLIATLMQIESCGHPNISSGAGAQGLFQVMPFHFTEGETMTDPDTNARRGLSVIADCLQRADNDFGLAMACYNGGPRLIGVSQEFWPEESRNYYVWGTGIYNDAQRGARQSQTLERWLSFGGWSLCQEASGALGLPTSTPYLFPAESPTDFLPTLAPPGVYTPLPPGIPPTMSSSDIALPTALPGVLPTFDGGQ